MVRDGATVRLNGRKQSARMRDREICCRSDAPAIYDRLVVTGGSDAMQDIRFARSADGVGIAYAVHGSGPPLLIDACWLSHLQFDWQSPVWRHFLVELGRIATVIRYDERGHGLSDRGVTDHSLEARVADLAAVADDAGSSGSRCWRWLRAGRSRSSMPRDIRNG